MTDSKITPQLILVSHILIDLPRPLMIVHAQTKAPAISLIRYQPPFMLTQKYFITLTPPCDYPK